ncbi:MAG: DUF4232 domain-containing protein [Acidimicrobiales bacterium]
MRRGLISVAIFIAFIAIYTIGRHGLGTTATTTTTTTTTTATTTTTTANTVCNATDFSGAYNEGQGAAGTVEASVTLTKTTAGSCTLTGWPLMTLQDRLGAVLASTLVDVPSASNNRQFTVAKANGAPKTLTLTQNSTTNFSLAYSDVPTGATACESAVTLSVQFSANGAAINVTPPYPVQPCNAGQIWVSPFY